MDYSSAKGDKGLYKILVVLVTGHFSLPAFFGAYLIHK